MAEIKPIERPSDNTAEQVQTEDSPQTDGVVGLINMADPYASEQTKTAIVAAPIAKTETKTITQESLEQMWNELTKGEAINQLSSKEVIKTHMIDSTPLLDGQSVVWTLTSSFAEYEVRKKALAEVMTYLRKVSGVDWLSPKIVVKVEQKASLPYQATEKYEAMLSKNPELATLRQVFVDIDL